MCVLSRCSVPVLTDGDTVSLPLNPQLFPGVEPDVLVHDGFASEQAAYVSCYCPSSTLTGVIPGRLSPSWQPFSTRRQSSEQPRSLLSVTHWVRPQRFCSAVCCVLSGLTGAAISLLDAIYLHLQVPSAEVRFVGYGSPRVCT